MKSPLVSFLIKMACIWILATAISVFDRSRSIDRTFMFAMAGWIVMQLEIVTFELRKKE